ncbi:MAG: hydroxymethylpyrimidine transporter transrane component [Bacteriovoracaceae bacterium]|nr:hydroxymethylpyrimidine transporter transrane component [Bacteriovoracaceae bacterium]
MKLSRWIPLVPFAIIILLMEFLVRSKMIPNYLLPSPTEILKAFTEDSADLWKAAGETGLSALLGYLGSATLGLLLGIIFSSTRWIENAFYPYAIFFQTVPIIAIAPLLVIWFGYGMPTIIICTLIVSIFPIIASTLDGIRSTDHALIDLFKIYHARPLQKLFKLSLPFALPQIFVGLRISAGLAVIGAIVGEFIAGGGLGGIIDVARVRQRVDQVFAAVLLASAIGLIFVAGINLIASFALRHWHPSKKYAK